MSDAEQRVREWVAESHIAANSGNPPMSWPRLAPRVVAELLTEIDQLREVLDMYRNGYQGACMACEPVGEENQRLLAEVEQLKHELQECRNK